jgi:hypothetical protein
MPKTFNKDICFVGGPRLSLDENVMAHKVFIFLRL